MDHNSEGLGKAIERDIQASKTKSLEDRIALLEWRLDKQEEMIRGLIRSSFHTAYRRP